MYSRKKAFKEVITEALEGKTLSSAQQELIDSFLEPSGLYATDDDATLNCGVKIFYLEKALELEPTAFHEYLDRLYDNSNYPLIEALKRTNDLFWNNEIIYNVDGVQNYGVHKTLDKNFIRIGSEVNPDLFQKIIKNLILKQIARIAENEIAAETEKRTIIKPRKDAKLPEETAKNRIYRLKSLWTKNVEPKRPRNIAWRDTSDLPVAQQHPKCLQDLLTTGFFTEELWEHYKDINATVYKQVYEAYVKAAEILIEKPIYYKLVEDVPAIKKRFAQISADQLLKEMQKLTPLMLFSDERELAALKQAYCDFLMKDFIAAGCLTRDQARMNILQIDAMYDTFNYFINGRQLDFADIQNFGLEETFKLTQAAFGSNIRVHLDYHLISLAEIRSYTPEKVSKAINTLEDRNSILHPHFRAARISLRFYLELSESDAILFANFANHPKVSPYIKNDCITFEDLNQWWKERMIRNLDLTFISKMAVKASNKGIEPLPGNHGQMLAFFEELYPKKDEPENKRNVRRKIG